MFENLNHLSLIKDVFEFFSKILFQDVSTYVSRFSHVNEALVSLEAFSKTC